MSTTPTVYSDLSGIFNVQQQYLADLANLANKPGVSSDVTGQMSNLQGNLRSAYTAYQSALQSADAVLDNQQNMLSIISKENQRLNTKKQSVDNALFGQKRMAKFSDSYSKKYFAQIKILFIIIIVLIIYLGLTMLDSLIPFPSGVFLFIMIVISIFAFFVIMSTIRDINSRYNMDFDKLNLRAPSKMEISGNLDGNISAGGGGVFFCIGESCCPEGNANGTVWNSAKQQCISLNVAAEASKASVAGFTLMSQASLLEPTQNVKGLVNPYEPSEINSYTKI
jgi:hypothetical protein